MKKYLTFNPPTYDSLEQNYKANLVFTLGWSWIIGVTVIVLIMTMFLPVFWARAAETIISVDVTSLICLWLNRKGYLRGASVFFSFTLWLIVSGLALTSGGIYGPAVVAYLPVIVTTGFLLGGTSGIWMAVLCVLTSLAFVLLQMHGLLPPSQIKHTPVSLLLAYSVSGMLIAVMQYLITDHISNSIEIIMRETDERKNAEAKLKESEFNNRMVVENKILGVAWATAEGTLMDASNTFCEMFGYTVEELKGKFFGDFTHPEDTAKELKLLERIINKEMDSYTIEKRYKHKDGSYFWVELHLTCYRNAGTGKVDFYIGIVQNIQQRKLAEEAQRESEERYRTLVDNATEALVVFDVESRRFVSVSESAVQLFKVPKEELLKMGPADISPEFQPDGRLSSVAAMKLIKETIHGGKPVFEWMHWDIDGKPVPVEIRLVRLPSATRVLIRGSMIDITERKAAEAAIKELNESLEKKVSERTAELEILNRDLFRFNTMLSHDLRGAIRRIKSFGDILQKKIAKSGLADGSFEDLEIMRQDAAKMDGIVNGLLEMSKLGSKPVQLVPVNLNETIKGIIDDLKEQWKHKQHEVEVPALPAVNSDVILIQQIFTNVLTNAFKYSSKNEVIKVTIRGTDKGDHYLFSVTDNGVGFNMGEHDNLFKEFTRLHQDDEFEGTGLGLSSVKRFVEKLGGRIWAESVIGQGSTFYFTVLLREAVSEN